MTVRNHRWTEVRVYVATPSGGHRLGVVPSMESRTFALPAVISLPSDLRFIAVPFAEDAQQETAFVAVSTGERFVYDIELAASQSTLVRRP